MVTMRRVFGGAIALACVVALSGFRPTVADEKKLDGAPTGREKGAEVVDQLAAAQTLIQFAESDPKNPCPLALLAAAEVLYRVGIKDGGPEDKALTVEGAKDETPDVKVEVKQLIDKALKMSAGDESIKKLAARLEDKLAEGSRGTPNGYTRWQGIVVPTNAATKTPVTTISRLFIGRQIGKISVSKQFNTGVPLTLRLYDPKGNVVQSVVGHSANFAFVPPADGSYKLVIANGHSVGVLVTVVTN